MSEQKQAVISKHDVMTDLVDLGASPEILKYLDGILSDDELIKALAEKEEAEELRRNTKPSDSFAFDKTKGSFPEQIDMNVRETFKANQLTTLIQDDFTDKVKNSTAFNDYVEMLYNTMEAGEELDGAALMADGKGIFELKADVMKELGLVEKADAVEYIDKIFKDNGITYRHMVVHISSQFAEKVVFMCILHLLKSRF